MTQKRSGNSCGCPLCRQGVVFSPDTGFAMVEYIPDALLSTYEAPAAPAIPQIIHVNKNTDYEQRLSRDLQARMEQIREMSMRIEELQFQREDGDGFTVDELNLECDRLENELETIQNQHAALQGKYNTIKKDLTLSTSQLIESNSIINSLKKKLSDTNELLHTSNQDYAALQSIHQALQSETQSMKRRIDSLRA